MKILPVSKVSLYSHCYIAYNPASHLAKGSANISSHLSWKENMASMTVHYTQIQSNVTPNDNLVFSLL